MTLSDLTYAAQFEVLRVWIGALHTAELTRPSVLPGWSVADLIAHLAGTGRTIATLSPAGVDDVPMSTADYVSNYARSAGEIAETARETTVGAGPELLAALDRANADAQHALDRLGGVEQVVLTRRGPMLLSDFLDTRLIELVVHSDDLARSLPDRPAPTVLPSARRRAVAVLRELLTGRADDPVAALAAASALSEEEFIELATGRVVPRPDLAPALAAAVPLF